MSFSAEGFLTADEVVARAKARVESLSEEERRAEEEEAAESRRRIDRTMAVYAANVEAIQRGPQPERVRVDSAPRRRLDRRLGCNRPRARRSGRRTAAARGDPESSEPPKRRPRSDNLGAGPSSVLRESRALMAKSSKRQRKARR
jgi:hypothetical protein